MVGPRRCSELVAGALHVAVRVNAAMPQQRVLVLLAPHLRRLVVPSLHVLHRLLVGNPASRRCRGAAAVGRILRDGLLCGGSRPVRCALLHALLHQRLGPLLVLLRLLQLTRLAIPTLVEAPSFLGLRDGTGAQQARPRGLDEVLGRAARGRHRRGGHLSARRGVGPARLRQLVLVLEHVQLNGFLPFQGAQVSGGGLLARAPAQLELLRHRHAAPHAGALLGELEGHLLVQLVEVGHVAQWVLGVLGLPLGVHAPALPPPLLRAPLARRHALLHPARHRHLLQLLLRACAPLPLLVLLRLRHLLEAILKDMLGRRFCMEVLLKPVWVGQLLHHLLLGLCAQLVGVVEGERRLNGLVPLPRGLAIAGPHRLPLVHQHRVARLHCRLGKRVCSETPRDGGLLFLPFQRELRLEFGGHDGLALAERLAVLELEGLRDGAAQGAVLRLVHLRLR
mmetsp:Transcript_7583/g.19226  ORF Transcript_7583/g.19226 Transcript_7583/m.19226 type:complete len:451 (+) Transcript_7583:223-1575(+)